MRFLLLEYDIWICQSGPKRFGGSLTLRHDGRSLLFLRLLRTAKTLNRDAITQLENEVRNDSSTV